MRPIPILFYRYFRIQLLLSFHYIYVLFSPALRKGEIGTKIDFIFIMNFNWHPDIKSSPDWEFFSLSIPSFYLPFFSLANCASSYDDVFFLFISTCWYSIMLSIFLMASMSLLCSNVVRTANVKILW